MVQREDGALKNCVGLSAACKAFRDKTEINRTEENKKCLDSHHLNKQNGPQSDILLICKRRPFLSLGPITFYGPYTQDT